MIKKILIGFAVFILIIVVIVAIQDASSPSPMPTAAPTAEDSTENGSSPLPSSTDSTEPVESTTPDLILIKDWKGNGIKTTEPFTIHRQPWNIVWVNTPEIMDGESMGILQIMIYRTNEPDVPVSIAANVQQAGMDTSFIYDTGDFFLVINAANTQWEVTVFEPSQ